MDEMGERWAGQRREVRPHGQRRLLVITPAVGGGTRAGEVPRAGREEQQR